MRKRWSILIVPNTSEQGYNIGVSAWALKLGALFVFVTFIAVVAFCAVRVDARKRQHIRIVSDLEQEISARDSNLEVIEKEFSRLLSLEDKLRAIAGLKPRQTAAEGVGMGGQGGPELSETILYFKDRPGRSGSAFVSPAASAVEMVKAVLLDERRVMPAAVRLDGEYGYSGICLGVPIVLGAGGVRKVVELELSPDERAALGLSAEAVRKGVEALDNL